MKIREAIDLAKMGYTHADLLKHFELTEKEYQREFRKFSEINRRKLKSLLISNGKRRASRGVNQKKVLGDIKILDTSYILSDAIDFTEIGADTYILPEVYEQLIYHEKKHSQKLIKFFHLLIEEKITPKLVKESYVPDFVPEYEDDADLEIIEFSKLLKVDKIPGIIANPIVYTADKALALRCKQQEIDFVFVGRREIENLSHSNECNDLKKDNIDFIIEKRGGDIGINPKMGALIYDKNMKLKKAAKFGLIILAEKDTIIFNNKTYLFSGGNVNEIG